SPSSACSPSERRPTISHPLTPTAQEPMMTAAPTPAARPSGLSLDQVDEGVRIQDDLFGHVNGTWLREHVMPADRSSDGAFHALRDLSEERVREVVEEAARDAEAADPRGEQVPTTDHARVGARYRMFMDTAPIGRAGFAVFQELRSAVTSATGLQAITRAMAAAHSGASALLAYVWTADKDSSSYQVKIHRGGLGLPDESYYREDSYP